MTNKQNAEIFMSVVALAVCAVWALATLAVRAAKAVHARLSAKAV